MAQPSDISHVATAAERLLERLRSLVEELDPEERKLLAALLAPGIELAYTDHEVEGFALEWSGPSLPTELAEAVRDREIRILGL